MLSLFYIPSLIYNLIYNYLNPQQDEESPPRQSKYADKRGFIRPRQMRIPILRSEDKFTNSTINMRTDLIDIKPDISLTIQGEQSESTKRAYISPPIQIERSQNEAISVVQEDMKLPNDDITLYPIETTPTEIAPVPQAQIRIVPQVEMTPVPQVQNTPKPQIKPKVVVALSDSDSDSDSIKEFLADVVSIEATTLKHDTSVKTPVTVDSASAPLLSNPPGSQILMDNSHVIFEDDDEEYPPVPQNISSIPFIVPNSFSHVSKPPTSVSEPDSKPPSSVSKSVSEPPPTVPQLVSKPPASVPEPLSSEVNTESSASSTSPDTELPSYNPAQEHYTSSVPNNPDHETSAVSSLAPQENSPFPTTTAQDSSSYPSTTAQDSSRSVSLEKHDVAVKSVTMTVEEGIATMSSISTDSNQAAAVCTGNGNGSWDDVPNETQSLTSQKHGEIKKHIPKERQKRKRSDLEWNQYMEKCMLAGARGKILNSFRQCYREAFDTYRLCCDMLITFGITHASGRTVFQRAALDEIRLWKQDTVAPRPSISNQLKALDVSYLCNSSLFPAIRDVFELETVPAHEAVMFIEDKLDHKRTKYIKHMALIITELQLQEYFDTAEMLLPLLGMDKLMTIEAYLCNKSLATTFVRALDDLLEPTGERITSLLDRLNLEFDYQEHSAQFKFTPEQITTLVKRLIKLYSLEGSAAPNLSLSKTVSNLKSILYCRYRKGATEDWTNTLITTVRDSEVLQHALFTELVMYRDLQYAALLYQHIQPKLNILPDELKRYISSVKLPSVSQESRSASRESDDKDTAQFQPEATSSESVESAEATTSKSVKGVESVERVERVEIKPAVERVEVLPADPVISNGYVSLPPSVSILDVNSPSTLQLCKDALCAASVIGFDSEWRALLDPTKPVPVAIVQFSTHNYCFLLDISSILNSCSEDVLTRFIEDVFVEDVTLVGYSLRQDFIKLTETCPIWGSKIQSHCRVVDLSIAHKHLTRADRVRRSQEIRELVSQGKPLPKTENISKETGLARLCEMIFSHPLDKTCQVSDWTRRPLFPEQRNYAALDAYILLPLYYKLTQHFHPTPLLELTSEVAEIPEEGKVVSYIPAFSTPTPSFMLRVVVDVPCQGLGKKLRHLGVDCVILENTQCVDDAAKISLAEGRIILSRDGNSDKLVRLTDPGRVYKVLGSSATVQLAEIRQHFNLVVAEEDLFSRCAICNCPYFLRLLPGQARALKDAQEVYNSSTVEEMYEVFERRQSLVETVSVTSDGVTQYGVRLQLDKVKMHKFTDTKIFWGCNDCGKMYWDGCHIKNFKEKHNL